MFVAPREGGLRTAAGIGVDAKRRSLWVASGAMPHMEGYEKDSPLQSAIFEFDADTGKLRRELRPPATAKAAAFDDLAVAADGRVYVNDGENGRVWTLAPGAGALEVFLETDLFRGTQGLAPTPDGRSLYLSDYSGLYRVDVATKQITRLAVPAEAGAERRGRPRLSGGRLYAIQNGVEPNRIIRVDLGADGATVTGAKISRRTSRPSTSRPSVVVAEGALYVVANSQGGKFRNEKTPIAPEAMTDAVILKVPLEPAAR